MKNAANTERRFSVQKKAATRTAAFLQTVVHQKKGKIWQEQGRLAQYVKKNVTWNV